jgi:hypothetical protein
MRDERASAGARPWAQPRWFESAERWLRPMDRHMMGSTVDWLRKVIATLRPPAEAGVPPGRGGEA